jgi:hypothetical protein
MPWSARLPDPIHLADGRTLRTLSDVRAMLLKLPEDEQTWPKANTMADLIIRAARPRSAALTAVISGRIEEFLRFPPFLSARIVDDDVVKRPARLRVRRVGTRGARKRIVIKPRQNHGRRSPPTRQARGH